MSAQWGQQISLQCAVHGYDVIAYDISPDSLKEAKAQIDAYAAQLVAEGYMTQKEADIAVARIIFSHNPEEVLVHQRDS